jgi:hypothetical protein
MFCAVARTLYEWPTIRPVSGGPPQQSLFAVVRDLAFPPETLNQFDSRRQVFDKIDAKPCKQDAFLHFPFEFSTVGRRLVTKNLAPIGPSRENIAFAGPLTCWWTSRSIPHNEGTVP